jgi:hypothetical protein
MLVIKRSGTLFGAFPVSGPWRSPFGLFKGTEGLFWGMRMIFLEVLWGRP